MSATEASAGHGNGRDVEALFGAVDALNPEIRTPPKEATVDDTPTATPGSPKLLAPPARLAAVLDPAEARERIRQRTETLVPLPLPVLNEAFGKGLGGMDVLVVVGPPRSAKTTLALFIGLAVARRTGRKLFIYAPDQGGMSVFRWLSKVFAAEPDPDEAFRRLVVLVDETKDVTDLDSFIALLRHRSDEVGVVLVDSAQTVLAPDAESETAKVIAAMKAAKEVGDALIVPVIVTSQANRPAWRSANREERSSPLSAGLNSSSIEYRATVHIFTEKVSKKGEPPEFRLEVSKSAHGQDGLVFRLRLDPDTMVFSESAQDKAEEEERSSDVEIRRWKALVEEALPILKERWTAGETPSGRDLHARMRAARKAKGLKGPSTAQFYDLVAYLENEMHAIVTNEGPNRSRLVCRPTVLR